MSYIIAEIGSNHNGEMILAQRLIEEAERTGVDAIKFQSWTPESLYAKQWLMNNPEAHEELAKHSLSIEQIRYLANKVDVDFICSVFSRQEVDELEDVVDLFKVASMDVTNKRLLEHIASKRKPVIMSCGMATMSEIAEAVGVLSAYNRPLTLLHCVSLYPPRHDQIGLRKMRALKIFDKNIGYSDHTEGIDICLSAVTLGAQCIEKHFTLDKELHGWDHKISATPDEMAKLVRKSKLIELAMRIPERISDEESRLTMRRSIVSARNIKKGERITESDVVYRRPGTGLSRLPVKARAKREIPEGCLLGKDDLK